MKSQIVSSKSLLLGRVLSAGLALALLGAAQAQGKSPAVDLVKLRKDLGELQAQVSETTSTLEALKKAAKENASLKAAHTAFASKFNQLESQINNVRTSGMLIRTRADDHYKSWQGEISKMGNPKLREKAMNRYAEAKEEFDEIIVIAEEAKRELAPFMADLKDVATYLKTDLSSDAVKSLSNAIWKLGNKSRAVVASIQHVSTQISRALEELPENK
jgi:hypothetical protein